MTATAAPFSSVERPRQDLSESSSSRARAPRRRGGGGPLPAVAHRPRGGDDVEVERREEQHFLLGHGPRREGLARRLGALEVVEMPDGEVGPQGGLALGGQLLVEELFLVRRRL